MDIGLYNQQYHEWVIRNSDKKTNHPELNMNLWIMINKNLNEGMSSEKYWIIQTHALNLANEIIKNILGNEYDSTAQNDNIDKLIAMGYDIQILEKLDFVKVVNFTTSNFARLAFSLKSIGNLLYKLRLIEKEDIRLNPDKLRAEVGEVIDDKYIITKFLGASDSGRVLEATCLGRDNKVAVKEIRKSSYPIFDMENEKKILMLLDHPAISKIHDVLRDNQTYYIVMDFIEGKTLTAYIEEQGKLELPLVIKLAKELVEMINYKNTNQYGKIDSNLNPDSIMIDGQQHLHLIDFGVNYNKKSKFDKVSMFTGGGNYLSPELIEGMEADLQSDIFSLGGIIYYMVEGRKPIPGSTQTFRSATDYNLAGIIEKAMAKNLKMRYLSTQEFLYDLELLEASLIWNSDDVDEKEVSEIHCSPERLSKIMIRNLPNNKGNTPEMKHQVGGKKIDFLEFGVQLFLGILFISGVVGLLYLINNNL